MEQTIRARLPHYDRQRGEGPALVFLHYWGGSGRTWNAVTGQLPGREVITLDFRGWGRSRALPGPYGLHQLAGDTLAVVADAGVPDYVLVGHSMGGKVAQLIAAARPAGLRGLVLVAPAPAEPPAAITPEYRETLSHAYDSDESAATARDRILTATPLSRALKSQVAEDSRASSPAARQEWPLRGIAEDISEQARLTEVPVLVIAGERDQVEPAGILRDHLIPHLPDAEVQVIPGTGHLIPLEAPERLAGLIRGFERRSAVERVRRTRPDRSSRAIAAGRSRREGADARHASAVLREPGAGRNGAGT